MSFKCGLQNTTFPTIAGVNSNKFADRLMLYIYYSELAEFKCAMRFDFRLHALCARHVFYTCVFM